MKNFSEDSLYKQIAFLMKYSYPDVIYRFDFGAGVFLHGNFRLMNLQKAIQMFQWKHPDLTIYEPSVIDGKNYHGLCLELKAEGEKIFKKDGKTYVSKHIEEQAAALKKLKNKGYLTSFAVGLNEAKELIDMYLKGASGLKKKGVKI